MFIIALIKFSPESGGKEEGAEMSYSDLFVQPRSLRLTEALMKETVLGMIKEAGFDTKIADAIIRCESGWNPRARHLNKNGSWDIGLWQINDIHKLSVEDRMDVIKGTEFAIKLLQSKRSYSHWVCF